MLLPLINKYSLKSATKHTFSRIFILFAGLVGLFQTLVTNEAERVTEEILVKNTS